MPDRGDEEPEGVNQALTTGPKKSARAMRARASVLMIALGALSGERDHQDLRRFRFEKRQWRVPRRIA